MLAHLLVFGFYLGIALVMTWPLATNLATDLIGHPFGDTYEYVRHIWWMKHALQTGQPLYSQPLLGYPAGLDGGWLWAVPLQSFPAWLFAFVMPLPAAFNVSALLRLALNGWSMQVLARHLTSDRRGPALLAGVIFMAFPTFQGQLAAGHTGLLALWPVPLLIYSVLRLEVLTTPSPSPSERGEKQKTVLPIGWVLLVALLFCVSLWGSFTLLIFFVGPVTLLLLIRQISGRQWLALRHTIIALVLGGMLELVFIGPFLLEQACNPTLIDAGSTVEFSADLLTIITPSFQNPLFSGLDYTHQLLGIDPFERMGYVGVVALLLALVGLWRTRESRWWLGLAGIAWILALGPLLKILNTVFMVNLGDYGSYVTLPWTALATLPLLNMTRTPARFYFVIALAVAIMAGYGAAFVWDRARRFRWPLLGILMAVIVLEYQAFWPLPMIPGEVPGPIRALAERDDLRAVLDVPWAHPLAQKDGMFLQTGHHQPLIAGHIARRTPVDPARLNVLQATFDTALLDWEGVDMVIWHKQWAASDAVMPWRDPFYEDENIAAFEVAAAEGEPAFQAALDHDEAIEDKSDSYFFAPEPGWLTLSGQLETNGRMVNLLQDNQLIHRWQGAETMKLELPLPVFESGYHTVSLALDPPCPSHYAAGLRCQSVTINDLALTGFMPAALTTPVQFDRGLTLHSQRLMPEADGLTVTLLWAFAAARAESDIRFIHVLDENGDLIGQDDHTLGVQSGGGAWVEQIEFDDLPPGTYNVYTGWYSYPDVTPFAVLGDVPDSVNNRVYLGTVGVGS